VLLKQIGNEDSLCNTSLIAACMYGYQEMVTLLLEYGCDPNGSTEIRPLSSATEYSHTHVAKLLLKYNSISLWFICEATNRGDSLFVVQISILHLYSNSSLTVLM
jgi:ankyrin repeat protein